jgi:prepilin-type N-terminal cleavage/methylation domain-containing protein
MSHKSGFTLIEVLIVVIILGILATIAVPQFTSMVARARLAEAWGALGQVKTAQEIHRIEMGRYANNTTVLQINTAVGLFTVGFNGTPNNTHYVAQATGTGLASQVRAQIRENNTKRHSLNAGATWTAWSR